MDPEVYDAHEAFEIDQTKMKMLVPLDINGNRIINTRFDLDLKFRDLFKIYKCYFKVANPQGNRTFLFKIKDNHYCFSNCFALFRFS